MSALADLLVVLGSALPALGIVATAIAAGVARGPARWLALAVIPGVTLAVCWLVAAPVFRGGNAVAASAYILFAAALALYYPLLAVAWAIARYRRVAGEPARNDDER